MEEWKEYSLGDITDLVIDYRGKTPLKLGSDWSDSGYRALSAKNIKTGQIVAHDSIRFVDEALYHKWMKDEVKRGDILITSEAPFGQVFYWDSDEKIVLSQRLFCVRINADYDSKYVYYYMTTSRFQSEMSSRASGTTVLGLRQPELLKCNISVPSLEIQRHIASILSSFDDKIAVNKKICENLEAQAQALFKHWFVDFAPFKDGKFVESELGLIPEGWRVGNLGEICTYSSRKIAIKKLTKNTYYSTENMLPNKSGAVEASSLPQVEMTTECLPYDVLVSNIRPYFKKIIRVGTTCGCSTDVLCFHPIDPKYMSYMYRVLYDDSFFAYVMAGSKGTKMPRGDKQQIMQYSIAIPTNFVLKEFSNLVEPMFELISLSNNEIQTLSSLRDTLLPKLMSGEIKVDDVK